jgi:hypothetical protein
MKLSRKTRFRDCLAVDQRAGEVQGCSRAQAPFIYNCQRAKAQNPFRGRQAFLKTGEYDGRIVLHLLVDTDILF